MRILLVTTAAFLCLSFVEYTGEFRKYTLEEMAELTADKLELETVEFTEEQMVRLRAGEECLRCDLTATDPNMRPTKYKGN